MSKLAIYMGIGDPNKTALENSEILINYIKELNNTFGIPTKIKGLLDCDIDVLAKTSYKEAVPLYPCIPSSPALISNVPPSTNSPLLALKASSTESIVKSPLLI